MQLRRSAIALAAVLLAAPLAACGGRPSNDFTMPNSLDELIKQAKSEGTFTMYSSLDDTENHRVIQAFSKKYGIKGSSIYLTVAQSQVRLASEAGTGKPGADLMFGAGFEPSFLNEAVGKRWLEPVANWKLLGPAAGFPKKYLYTSYAMVDSTPMVAVYNTKANAGPPPAKWTDLADPRFKGKLVLANPNGSQVYVQQWARLIKAYGTGFVKKVAANGPITWVANMDAAIQAVAANQGVVGMPVSPSEVVALKNKGASVAPITLPDTTGTEMKMVLTAPRLSTHPAAARLFANWIMSREGSAVLTAGEEGVSAYEQKTGLPKGYEPPVSKNIDALTKQVAGLLRAPAQ